MTPQDPHFLYQQAAECLEALRSRTEPLKPRERMAMPPQPMPEQPPQVRCANMSEVALGYSPEQAQIEAMRCLQCRNQPCVQGCPVQIDIPGFLRAVAEGDFRTGITIIKNSSLLPAVCGRVCPQESQCQALCTVGKKDPAHAVSIGRVERFLADWERDQIGEFVPPQVKPETGRKVAVVGSGPAGITVAADVRREGHAVTLFEAFHKPGGVMIYGIPEFRLPKLIVQREMDTLLAMGVEIRTNFVVGRTRTIEQLLEEDGYDAVFVGTGAGLPKFLNIPGEHHVGVFSANEYLTRCNLMRAYDEAQADTPVFRGRQVAVVGGGNVAMDAARTALRLGAEVTLVYRRTEEEMPARQEERHHAKEEGVRFLTLSNPTEILGDAHGLVTAMTCQRYRLGEPDASGRRAPVPIEGDTFTLSVDTVIVAIGNDSNPLIKQTTPGLETNRRGNLVVDARGCTTHPRIFAGGDIVLGAATVILAMGEGRRAAAAINALLAEEP